MQTNTPTAKTSQSVQSTFPGATELPVALRLATPTSSEMVWCRDNLQTLVSAQLVEKQRKVASAKAAEAAKKAGALVADYQQKFGDAKGTLKRLADRICVNVSTLYRWRRVHEGKPATKSSTPVVKVCTLIRRKFDGRFLQHGHFQNDAKWTSRVQDAADSSIDQDAEDSFTDFDKRRISAHVSLDERGISKAIKFADDKEEPRVHTRKDWESVEVKVTYTVGKAK